MIKSISISAIADLHGHLPQMRSSDLAVVAGDIFPGALDKDLDGQEAWFRAAFLPWVNKQERKGAICVFYFIWELFRSLDHKLQEIAENGCFVTR